MIKTSSKVKKMIKKTVRASLTPRATARSVKMKMERRKINKTRFDSYQKWFSENSPSTLQLEEQKRLATNFKLKPLISIILPIYNTPEKYLRDCIDSVLAQTYDNWELCIADDASPEPIIEVVKEYSDKYKNIKWTRHKDNVHIAGSSNEAIKLARGEYIALLDHDDLLLPHALYHMVEAINDNPGADLFYSDEDKIEEGKGHLEPFFKPDWSPDFLHSCNYITHFAVLRKSIVDKIGGFRVGTEGAQDWDLFLRFTKVSQAVVHIPKILYVWRKSPTSTAKTAHSKPYAYVNQLRVLRESLRDNKFTASVYEHKYLGFWRVRYHISDSPLVSIIIPTKDNPRLLKRCLESIIEKSTYPNFEIVIVDTGSHDKAVEEIYNSKLVASSRTKVAKWSKKFNFSGACNFGAKNSDGEYLVFMNDDTEVINADWLESLLEHAQRPDIGMVGGKLLFPDDRIQHAGVVLSHRDIAFHPFYGDIQDLDIFTVIYASNIRNVSAVTAACSMVSRKKFYKVGGFEEKLRITYNDVDLCLKLLESGYFNVYTPYAEIYHHESISVGKISTDERDKQEFEEAKKYMLNKWLKYLERDPFYNDNFVQHGPGYYLDS